MKENVDFLKKYQKEISNLTNDLIADMVHAGGIKLPVDRNNLKRIIQQKLALAFQLGSEWESN